MKLGFIGAGEMGGAIIRGLLKSGWPKEDILASVASAQTAERLAKQYGISASTDNRHLAEKADVVLIAVKPTVVPQVLAEIQAAPKKPVVCMALGWTLEKLQKALPGWPVVRIMPNTPLALCEGITLFAFGKEVNEAVRQLVESIFAPLGKTMELSEELFDAGTAVSGSGPAFVYAFIDALAQAGVSQGLAPEQAVALAVQTVIGASKMVETEKISPAELAQKVATPGGCTAAGMAALQEANLTAALEQTIAVTVAKAKEVAGK